MKTKGFSIGIIFLVLLVCTTCTKDDPLLTSDGEPFALKSAVSASDFDFSESVTLFGPMKIERTKSKPVTVVKKIHIENYDCFEINFMVEIRSGDLHGNNCVSSGIVIINDEAVLSQKDFKNKALFLSLPMELPESFNIEVRLNGKPGDFVTVEIKGIKICTECGSTFIDERDGQEYETVQIGDQCWMAENLKATMYNDGTPIPFVNDNQVWQNTSTAAYCWYDNDEITYKDTYGALYNWFTVETGKLCPKGWHVPSDAEWKILEMYLGMTQEEADSEGTSRGDVGGKLKEAGLVHWQDPNYGATNETGFTALPGGNHEFGGEFSAMYLMCQMWSSTPFIGTPDAWQRFVSYGEATVGRDHPCKADGKSVRCVKDAP